MVLDRGTRSELFMLYYSLQPSTLASLSSSQYLTCGTSLKDTSEITLDRIPTLYKYMWQSQVDIPLHNSTMLMHCSAKLSLRAGLICTVKMHEYLISLRSA